MSGRALDWGQGSESSLATNTLGGLGPLASVPPPPPLPHFMHEATEAPRPELAPLQGPF